MDADNPRALDGLPLRALLVFEAAARHRNMVRAAVELGMTQGAVSRHVRALEDRLHEQLFRRGPRGLVLTEAGDVLSDYVARGFSELSAGLYRIGQPRQRTTLAVSCSRTFALRVLAPRIGGFIRAHAWIDLRIESHRYYTPLDRSDADLAIRLGDGKSWGEPVILPLTREALFPVCAPGLLQDPMPDPAAFLRGAVLLHYAERPYWAVWLRCAGLDPALAAVGPRFDETALTLAAAEAGQGIAMARSSHVERALAAGTLVRPFTAVHDDGTGYFIATTAAAQRRSTTQAFIGWCRRELRHGIAAPNEA
ncbi:MAG TPA: LysR substrate-binding domain-containing protein [Roseomonas sp.]|jgi:DNA-binding transcriptional LysR family regulator